MSNTKIKFGTDGWRGIIADDFTFANVRRVAQATADYWNAQPLPKKTIVGYDNRFFSEVYARLVCEVLAANGFETMYAPEAVPTPAISFAVRDQKLCGAVMITASHNPPAFNGYKIKADFAGSATPEICAAIEARVDASPVKSVKFEDAVEIYDPRLAHVAFIKKMVDLKAIKRAKLRVVFDSMHGCGSRVLEKLAGGTTIRGERDVLFGGINPEPTSKNLGALMTAVKAQRAHIGLATDGDADRIAIVDERGEYITINDILLLIYWYMHEVRGERGGVVRNLATTHLLDRLAAHFGASYPGVVSRHSSLHASA